MTPNAVLNRTLRELAEIWSAPPSPGELPKCRACTMNLVVVSSPDIAERYTPVVDDVTRGLPARAIVVSLEPGAPDALDADATAVCAFGDAQAVCSERVTLRAGGRVCERIASAIDALCVPEMPTTLVWLGPIVASDPLFDAAADLAQRVVTDSEYTSLQSFLELARWSRAASHRANVADLAWTRLAVWQEMFARFFDEPALTAHADKVTRFELRQASDAGAPLGSEAALFVAWVATRLGWAIEGERDALRLVRSDGVAIDVRFGAVARPQAVAPLALASVVVEATHGGVTLRGAIERDLASGLPGETPDTDVLVWRLDAPVPSATEQRVRLRTNRGAKLLERTLHRPMRDAALIEAASFVERLVGAGASAT